ncbi:MAG: UDP-N-acetylmuramoyl-L-alanine--D-glutamate ligase [Phycisphaera sp.]|nr:MAG: UDP-N-acetylmuramoyl-L-alanine--D-glutamate ligase [Phycisphaera sp.]
MSERATIMGLGRYGGGAGAARYLVGQGYDVTVTDLASEAELAGAVDSIRDLVDDGSASLHLGEHNVSDFTTCTLLVANPAVRKPWENRFIRSAQAADVRITTEIGLAIDAIPDTCKVVGVTGSAGKSTTSAMLHAGLVSAGQNAILGGNIGGSLLGSVDSITQGSTIVLELSSAMLWWLAQTGTIERGAFLDAAVITNISSNHIDWHGSEEHYRQSKLGIASLLKPEAPLLTDKGAISGHSPNYAIELLDELPELRTPGTHNRLNASAALIACELLGCDLASATQEVAEFAGLPHRLEFVRELHGVRWYNDSKSTTPEASSLALDALASSPVHLIVGGSDKGVDLTPITDLAKRAASLVCIGQTGEAIAERAGVGYSGTIEQAVKELSKLAKTGDAVVLSPGCASFDQFKNFEHRGDRFKELVHSLA